MGLMNTSALNMKFLVLAAFVCQSLAAPQGFFGLQGHPNGAVTPIDEPRVADLKADHLPTPTALLCPLTSPLLLLPVLTTWPLTVLLMPLPLPSLPSMPLPSLPSTLLLLLPSPMPPPSISPPWLPTPTALLCPLTSPLLLLPVLTTWPLTVLLLMLPTLMLPLLL